MAGTEAWRRHSYPVQPQSNDDEARLASPTIPAKAAAQQPLPRTIRACQNADTYRHKGRNLIVCLDGTGDKFDADNSNIVHIVGALKKDDPSQVTYYQSGIGTYGAGGVTNGLAAALDMAVGSGLGVHVQDAYHFLMETYREGDKISIFGFSRGAYTARCLAGMLHKCGLLPKHNVAQLPFCYQFYKDDTTQGWKMSRDFKKTFCIDCSVHFVGVFDCVASVGFIPRKLPFSSTPTSKTGHFRHAMALDEHRAKFKVCHWQRIGTKSQQENDAQVRAEHEKAEKAKAERQNGGGGILRRMSTFGKNSKMAATPQMNGKLNGMPQESKQVESAAEKDLRQPTGQFYKESDVKEVWFMGCHADVGGGAVKNEERHKLSQIPLRWMIRQCFECDTGIIFNTAALAELGLDVHTLWPQYTMPKKPVVGPSPRVMDKYEQGLLGPIQNRSSHYETFDDTSSKHSLDESKLPSTAEEDEHEHERTKCHPKGEWTDELHENHFDAKEPANDQLVQAKGWWVLEVWPIKVRVQRKGRDDWEKKVSMNLGRFRAVQETAPVMHWTVRQRMDDKAYKLRTRVDRNAIWSTCA